MSGNAVYGFHSVPQDSSSNWFSALAQDTAKSCVQYSQDRRLPDTTHSQFGDSSRAEYCKSSLTIRCFLPQSMYVRISDSGVPVSAEEMTACVASKAKGWEVRRQMQRQD